MAIAILPDMLPVMDWHAENKPVAWNLFKKRMKLYFNIAHTEHDMKVNNILFLGGKEASDRWETLKDQGKKQEDLEEVFEAFAQSSDKS